MLVKQGLPLVMLDDGGSGAQLCRLLETLREERSSSCVFLIGL